MVNFFFLIHAIIHNPIMTRIWILRQKCKEKHRVFCQETFWNIRKQLEFGGIGKFFSKIMKWRKNQPTCCVEIFEKLLYPMAVISQKASRAITLHVEKMKINSILFLNYSCSDKNCTCHLSAVIVYYYYKSRTRLLKKRSLFGGFKSF